MGKEHKILYEEILRVRQIFSINEVKQIFQPTGNSCGPTCIKMVGEFLKGEIPEIEKICKACGTDWLVGTPPEKMEKGLKEFNINYKTHFREREPFQSLQNTFERGNLAIVRTLTQQIPHWIVIKNFSNDEYEVNDPWLGEIKYTEKELEEIWKVRDFFYYEIITGKQKEEKNVQIRKMKFEDLPEIYNKFSEVFDKTGLSNDEIWDEIWEFDLGLSLIAEVGDEIAGFYFLADKPIPEVDGAEDYEKLKNLKGLEGMALGVLKKFKNLGIGKKLITQSQNMGFDYIWGYQLKSLKNIDDWLKRRKLYAITDTTYITYQVLK